ncbi:MAG: alpha/beta hydrolase [Vicingaceae bacterium]
MYNNSNSLCYKNTSLAYIDKGKGRVIVLLHGFLMSKEIWGNYVNELSGKNRVIAIDLLGHGQSGCLGYVHSIEMMAEAVSFILKKLKIRKYYLVGHSMGGYVACAVAEKNPDNVCGIILVNSTSRNDSKEKIIERKRAIKVVQLNHRLFINEAIPNLFNTDYKPYKRAIKKIIKIALKTPVQGIVAALEGMKERMDREVVLKFSPYPVLFILGKKDNILDYKELIEQAKNCEADYEVFKRSGHMSFIENETEVLNTIRNFVKKNK